MSEHDPIVMPGLDRFDVQSLPEMSKWYEEFDFYDTPPNEILGMVLLHINRYDFDLFMRCIAEVVGAAAALGNLNIGVLMDEAEFIAEDIKQYNQREAAKTARPKNIRDLWEK